MTKDECRRALLNDRPITSLATLIEVAIEDSLGLDRTLYRPNSVSWHKELTVATDRDLMEKVCMVCDAGAVMAGTLGEPRARALSPLWYKDRQYVMSALYALNCARTVNMVEALNCLGLTFNEANIEAEFVSMRGIGHYFGWDVFEQHRSHMEGVVERLRELEAAGRIKVPARLTGGNDA